MTITTYVSMDLALAGAKGRVNAMQNDKYTRQVVLCLYEQGIPWVVPDGVTAVVRYRKADGTGGIYDTLPDGSAACSIAENKVTLILAPQVCTAAGPVQLVVSLQRNEEELLTFPVQVQVHADPGEGIQSVNYTAWWGADNGCYNLFLDGDYFPDFDLGADYTEIDVTEHVDPNKLNGAVESGLGLRLWFTDNSRGTGLCSAVLMDNYIVENGGSYDAYYCGIVADPFVEAGFGKFVLVDHFYEMSHTISLRRYRNVEVATAADDEPYVVHIANVRAGQVITQTFTLSDGSTDVSTINLDENDYPVSGTFCGEEWTQSWDGFDEDATAEEPGETEA